MVCPNKNFFHFNTSLCGCNPGYFYNTSDNSCLSFTTSGADDFLVGSGVDYSVNIPANIFAFDTIKKFTQSQAVYLEATIVILVSWLVFCFFVRSFGKLGDGTTPWFRIRWWIS
ncbi:hypothetical protein QVD17_30650 [Tagetes erecta]|uniref:Uncharacterized protein n=1 Tax=Tagetes erecta TaxID=13708 RepID=A0AAD8NNL0_TARER|nr:hypothetical protein QVD17_30650 [Tagetes erecta]